MADEVKTEEKKPQEKKIFAEGRGKYSLIDAQKVFNFEFPLNSTLEENLASISDIKDQIIKAIADKNEREKKEAEEKTKKGEDKK